MPFIFILKSISGLIDTKHLKYFCSDAREVMTDDIRDQNTYRIKL